MDDIPEFETVESAVPKSTEGKRTTKIWKEDFTLILAKDTNDGIPKGRCNHCGRVLKAKSAQGTSNLNRHLEVCPKRKIRDVSQMSISTQGKLASKQVDFEVVKEKLDMMSLFHEYPLSFVEHPKFRDFVDYVWPEARHISRNTLKATIKKMNVKEESRICSTIHKLPGRICFTSDMWTSSANQDYICLTAHFIDDDWTLNSVVLNMHHLPPPHTAVVMHDCLLELIKGWGIQNKMFTITLDNARSNDNMQDLLLESISVEHPMPCFGKYFHVRCGAHILNLIVQKRLKVIDTAVEKLRNACYWVERNEGRKMAFEDAARRKGCASKKGLCRDTPTRWNSTYDMLARALPFRLAFDYMAEKDLSFVYSLTTAEWDRVQCICDLLRPFNDITTVFSGTKYPTANLYFTHIWEIELCLKEHEASSDQCIKEMAKDMKTKFKKYWECYSMILAVAVVLDPKFKLEYVQYCYDELDETTSTDNVAKVRKVMEDLYEDYAKELDVGGASQVPTSVPEFGGRTVKFLLRKYDPNINASKSKLDVYLGESTVGIDEATDVLDWWKGNENRYPVLARMARDVLAIPITTVASESTFSLGGRLLTKCRRNTLPDIVELMIQTRSWMQSGENVQESEPVVDVASGIVDIDGEDDEDEGGQQGHKRS